MTQKKVEETTWVTINKDAPDFHSDHSREIKIIPALTDDNSIQILSKPFVVRVDSNFVFDVDGVSNSVFTHSEVFTESSNPDAIVVIFCGSKDIFGVFKLNIASSSGKIPISCCSAEVMKYVKGEDELRVVDSKYIKDPREKDSSFNRKIQAFDHTFLIESFADCLLFKHEDLGIYQVTWSGCQKLETFKVVPS